MFTDSIRGPQVAFPLSLCIRRGVDIQVLHRWDHPWRDWAETLLGSLAWLIGI